jgi:predicted DNA-binding transcriptional regulator YafY
LLRLTEGELLAVFLAERLLQQYRGTAFVKDIAAAFRKLTAQLPDAVTVHLEHLRQAYSFRGPAATEVEAETFRRLARAVREGRQLELVYWTASRDAEGRRVVDPYHLTSASGDWYLIAYCHLREEVRMFAPGRIRSLRETGVRFERPATFEIGEYLDGSFRAMRGEGPPRRVRLLFTAEAAWYVREKVWHGSQKTKERKDGSLELTLEVSHLHEVKQWVLSYGARCRVLEPEELREDVLAELRSALTAYR